MKKEKILFVTQYCEYAGAPMLALNIGKEMRRQGYNVFCICMGYGELYPKMLKIMPTVILPIHFPMKFVVTLFKMLGYSRVLVNTTMGAYIVPYAKKADMSVVTLVHELPSVIAANKIKNVAKNVVRYSDKIVFACNYVKRRYPDNSLIRENQACIIPQGLYKKFKSYTDEEIKKIRHSLGIPDGNKIVLGVGMGYHRKGIDLFSRVARKTQMNDSSVSFVWVGCFEHEKSMLAMGKRAGVIFVDNTDEVDRYFSIADVFLMTSREDPFPSVVLEALYFGLHAIGFNNAGGFCELPKEYVSLVDFEDIDAMKEKLSDVIYGKTEIEYCRRNGRNFIKKNYNFSMYVKKLLNCFKDIQSDRR